MIPRKLTSLRKRIVSVGEGCHAHRSQHKNIREEEEDQTRDELGTRRTTERVRDSETLGLRDGGLTSWRGWEGLAEFTLNCGMYEETHSGTWEAPDIVSFLRERDHTWSTLTGKAYAPRWRMSS